MPDALLDEVTALVEWPKVYTAGFDAAFLEVPQECLILTMQQNQKYFALRGSDGRLQNRFLLVSNLEPRDPQAIIRGNERVLRARLADAKFFYDQDRRVALASRVPSARRGRLPPQARQLRASAWAGCARWRGQIAAEIGADPALADRAALLAKADLVTAMVGEFPELQGTMGRYYALHDGEPAAVADALAQHYQPRFAGDEVPAGSVAQAVALADKLEALAGHFGVGEAPTGEKDPFGLRRAAIGVLRILIEGKLPVDLRHLIELAFGTFAAGPRGLQRRRRGRGLRPRPAARVSARARLSPPTRSTPSCRRHRGASISCPTGWPPCRHSSPCPKRRRWRRPTSASSTS